jgi:hypothetical protein
VGDFEYKSCHVSEEWDVETDFADFLLDGWIHIGTSADPTKFGITYASPTDFIYFFARLKTQ